MSQANPTQSGLLRRIVSSLLLLPFLLAVLYPFLWMIFGIFKTNREIYQPLRLWPMKPLETEYWSGIADTFFPNEFSMQNVRDLLVGKWVPFWDVFGNSLLVSLGQALGEFVGLLEQIAGIDKYHGNVGPHLRGEVQHHRRLGTKTG